MNRSHRALIGLLAAGLFIGILVRLPSPRSSRPDRITVKYWEKWTGFEADAMRQVVDDFNASQDRVFVDYTSVSQLNHRLMLATAGGVPPDVAGIYSSDAAVFAENNGLTPLDSYALQAGIKEDQYIDVYWRMCCYRNHLWALPSTPSSMALVWNKKLFREAGLDPERPPRSIAELEQFNDRLVKRAPDGSLTGMGYSPQVPGWNQSYLGLWFGSTFWDGKDKITADSPNNLAAYRWLETYPKRFGADKLLELRDGFGNYASPQDPFFSGRIAMVLQGPWIYNFIKNYAPADFEWGVAAFPSVDPEHLKDVTLVECDGLVIPHRALHPREAFEFIRFAQSQKEMEKLCLGQFKFSPLRQCSPDFFKNHPNPYIATFAGLAKSPNAHFAPQITTLKEYGDDVQNAVDQIMAGHKTADEAMHEVQVRQQAVFDRKQARWNRISSELTAE